MYLQLAVLVSLVILFVYIDGFLILYDRTRSMYRKTAQLKGLMQITGGTKNWWKIFKMSLVFIGKLLWLNILQKLQGNIRKLSNGGVELSYSIRGKLYKSIIEAPRGPSKILLITSGEGEDITDEVLPYFGPNYDFHGRDFTPSFWGYDSIHIELSNGDSLSFNKDAVITL